MNHISDTTDIGITFQMTLDAFLDETHPVKDTNQNTYRDALKKLEEANHCRSSQKKQTIAREALGICTDCIEAYLVLGINEQNMYRKLGMLKEGMELATMNLGKDFFCGMHLIFLNLMKQSRCFISSSLMRHLCTRPDI